MHLTQDSFHTGMEEMIVIRKFVNILCLKNTAEHRTTLTRDVSHPPPYLVPQQ